LGVTKNKKRQSDKTDKIVRRNITMPQSYVERLEKLRIERGSQSDSEVIRTAIRLLEIVMEKKLSMVDADGVKQMLMP